MAASRSGWNGSFDKDVLVENVTTRSHTYDIDDTPLLLPTRAFRRNSRPALSASLFSF